MSTNPPQLPPSRLRLRISTKQDATVVQCIGKLTVDVSRDFKGEVKGLIPQAKRLVIDLTELTYMDSSGIGAIVGLYVSAKAANCEFQLINFNQRVRELLGMTHLLSVFESCGQYFTKMP